MNSIGNSGINVQNTQTNTGNKLSSIVKNNSQEATQADKFQPAEDTKFDLGNPLGTALKILVGAGAVAGIGIGVGAACLLGGGVAAGVTAGVIGGVAGVGFAAHSLLKGFWNSF